MLCNPCGVDIVELTKVLRTLVQLTLVPWRRGPVA